MSKVTEKKIKLPTEDNLELSGTLFIPENISRHPTLVIGSALGVPRYFYFKFSRYLAENDIAVLTFDYRGIYQSRETVKSGSEITMAQWGSHDIEAALTYAIEEINTDRLLYLGHSCGGQLLGLAPKSVHIERAVFVACQMGYWKLWPMSLRYGILFTWQTILILAPFFNYLPTRWMGISSLNLPSGVARQWAQWGKTPGYLFNEAHALDTSRYGRMDIPLLAYLFDDDRLLAPPAAVDALIERYSQADVQKRRIEHAALNQKSIGHFGFFKEKLKPHLWLDTLIWLRGTE